MAELLKNKNLDINSELFSGYFSINNLNNYEKLYIISDSDFEKIKKSLNNIPYVITNKTIYSLLKEINNNSIIYIKSKCDVLSDNSLKDYIKSYKGIIIVNKECLNYISELNLVSDVPTFNEDEYVIIDKFGNIEIKNTTSL